MTHRERQLSDFVNSSPDERERECADLPDRAIDRQLATHREAPSCNGSQQEKELGDEAVLSRAQGGPSSEAVSFDGDGRGPKAETHDDDLEEWDCSMCGGDGFIGNDDPLWHGFDVDYIDCWACKGTGLRKHQTIF
jgi:hypothetical protein